MKVLAIAIGAAFGCMASLSAIADPPAQPPMNTFDFAFYDCAAGGAFQVTYDSDTPKTATMTTNDDNKQYVLTRIDVANGVAFSSGPTKFWTDGKSVAVEGTSKPLKNCKMKHD
ncbi:MAG: MliC family protein [Mycobacteriales bacterium]